MAIYAKIECGLPRDPKLVAAGPMARLLYIQTVLYCRENLTDGRLDAVLLPLVSMDIPTPKKHVETLVRLGALEEYENGWAIPDAVWRKWNPTKAEVDDMRRTEAERKASWRDKKKRDVDVPTGHDVAHGTRDAQPEGEGETEGETEQEAAGRLVVQNGTRDRAALIDAAARVVLSRRDTTGRSGAYLAAALNGIKADLTKWAEARSLHGDTAETIADAFDPPTEAAPALREINGRMYRHVQGSGFVAVGA